MSAARISLGRDISFSERVYASLTPDAVEVEHVDGYEVNTRRVLLDEVQLITLHRSRRLALVIGFACCALLFVFPVSLVPRGSGAWPVFVSLASPFLLGLLLHLALGTDYVTVFGRRSKARMAFNFRKGRAREVFAQLRDAVEAVQSSARPAPAADAPAPIVSTG